MSTDNLNTKPTIETILDRINTLGESLMAEIKNLHQRFGNLEDRVKVLENEVKEVRTELNAIRERLNEYDDRFDRLEGVTFRTHSEFVTMRGDFREWRKQLKDLLPAAPQTS